jgi:hypothetical protein
LNLLEHYIKEIISEEPFESDWTKKMGKKFIKIKVIVDCYGNIQERETIEEKEHWKEIKQRGFFIWPQYSCIDCPHYVF